MTDLKELAVAYWRLKKWVIECNAEKKLPAESSLRVIEEFLCENKITALDLTNQIYDAGLAVEIIYCENPDATCTNPIITEMLRPIILQDGVVILIGQIVISQPLMITENKTKANTKKSTTKASTKKDEVPKKPRKASSKKKEDDKNG